MKRFVVQVLLFFVVAAIIDVSAGTILNYCVKHAKGGDFGRNKYICNDTHEDILVFGSSRAIHHYNPQILSDSLGASCYNCGQDGNGAILNYGRYQLICQRYTPKLLLYDVTPGFDLLAGDDNHKYLGWLRAYYDNKGIPEVFESVDPLEKYKMISAMYRYNTKFIQILSDYIHPLQDEDISGFRPLVGKMDMMRINKKSAIDKAYHFDSLKIHYLNRIILESNKTKVVFVVSPTYIGQDITQYKPIAELCKANHIPFIDFSNDSKYVNNSDYFVDGSHLNSEGADEFTRDLLKRLLVVK